MDAHENLLLVKLGRGGFLRWLIYPSLIIFAVYKLVIAPELLTVSTNNGFDLSFAVSGLLYNSDVLMYD